MDPTIQSRIRDEVLHRVDRPLRIDERRLVILLNAAADHIDAVEQRLTTTTHHLESLRRRAQSHGLAG